jgi:hypothetical protein
LSERDCCAPGPARLEAKAEKANGDRPLVEILYFDGCPNHEPALSLVERIGRELGIEPRIQLVNVPDQETAWRLRFLGSRARRGDARAGRAPQGAEAQTQPRRGVPAADACDARREWRAASRDRQNGGPVSKPKTRQVTQAARPSAHRGDDCGGVRRELERLFDERFGIEHTTLQVDRQNEPPLLEIGACSPGRDAPSACQRRDAH